MARWDEEREWESGRERHAQGERGRGREERGGWRSDDTWRGGGWREAAEREDWRRGERGEGRWEGIGREPGGRAEWDRTRGRMSGAGHAGGRYGTGSGAYGYGYGGEEEERGSGGEGGWRRSSQYEPAGEGPGSWGPEGRYGGRGRFRESEEHDRGRPYGGFMGGMAEHMGEGEGRWEARSDFGRGERHEYRGRSDWGRGGEERGPMERLGERMREGWRKMTGRGPKGYKRSDERIREDVSESIARSDIDASGVEVTVENAEVTLTGVVESRWDKRMLEDIADDVFGVDEVHNHLRLRREASPQAGQTTTAQTGMSGQTAAGQPRPGQTQPGAGSSGHH